LAPGAQSFQILYTLVLIATARAGPHVIAFHAPLRIGTPRSRESITGTMQYWICRLCDC
jgi:hypothetical protein